MSKIKLNIILGLVFVCIIGILLPIGSKLNTFEKYKSGFGAHEAGLNMGYQIGFEDGSNAAVEASCTFIHGLSVAHNEELRKMADWYFYYGANSTLLAINYPFHVVKSNHLVDATFVIEPIEWPTDERIYNMARVSMPNNFYVSVTNVSYGSNDLEASFPMNGHQNPTNLI